MLVQPTIFKYTEIEVVRVWRTDLCPFGRSVRKAPTQLGSTNAAVINLWAGSDS